MSLTKPSVRSTDACPPYAVLYEVRTYAFSICFLFAISAIAITPHANLPRSNSGEIDIEIEIEIELAY